MKHHNIYFSATSETLNFNQLSTLTCLRPITGWSKNDLRKKGKTRYAFSRLTFDPFPNKAYQFEEKLSLLLTELENDKVGIKNLVGQANGYIDVCRNQYLSGNIGIHLDLETINRLSQLNLAVDIDQYIAGTPLKYE